MSDDHIAVTILEVLKGLQGADLLTALLRPSIELHYIPSNKGMIVPTFNGRIVPYNEISAIIEAFHRFYKLYSTDAITLVNEKAKRVATADNFAVDFGTARKSGYVLLIKSPDGLYRIGLCSNIAKRLKELSADKIYTIVGNYKCQDMRAEEFYWRKRFADFRHLDTEWLKLSPEQVQVFATRVPNAKVDNEDAGQNAKKVRMKAYWDTLAATVGTVADSQAARETNAIKQLLGMVDRNENWTDEWAFACLESLKNDKKYNGIIGFTSVLTYMPSFMARKLNAGKQSATGSEETRTSRFSDNEFDHV